MKKAIVPPVLLTVAHSTALRIIATKTSTTVIKENNSTFWSATKVVSMNNKPVAALKLQDTILATDPGWYADYE